MAMFSEAGVCTDMLQFQFTDTCGLQYSVDGGVTWIDVPGWDTFAGACFTGPTGPTGPTTALQAATSPGTPGNPQDVSTAQQACNIAAYLAADVLQASMAQMVTNYNDAKNMVDSVVALFELIPGVDAIFGLFVGAGAILYNFYTAATIADFTDASTDPTLLAELKCAIYGAILADGQVDSSNFADVVTAIGAVSYAHAEVITALVDYVDGLGVTGLEQLQLLGSTYAGDCSTCSSPPAWCYNFDFTQSDGGWVTDSGFGTWVPMVGWTGQMGAGFASLAIIRTFTGVAITEISVTWTASNASGGAGRDVSLVIVGGGTDVFGLGTGASYPAPTTENFFPTNTYDEIEVRVESTNPAAPGTTIPAIQIHGTGTNPFGASHCTSREPDLSASSRRPARAVSPCLPS